MPSQGSVATRAANGWCGSKRIGTPGSGEQATTDRRDLFPGCQLAVGKQDSIEAASPALTA